jgi:hypothetical protein
MDYISINNGLVAQWPYGIEEIDTTTVASVSSGSSSITLSLFIDVCRVQITMNSCRYDRSISIDGHDGLVQLVADHVYRHMDDVLSRTLPKLSKSVMERVDELGCVCYATKSKPCMLNTFIYKLDDYQMDLVMLLSDLDNMEQLEAQDYLHSLFSTLPDEILSDDAAQHGIIDYSYRWDLGMRHLVDMVLHNIRKLIRITETFTILPLDDEGVAFMINTDYLSGIVAASQETYKLGFVHAANVLAGLMYADSGCPTDICTICMMETKKLKNICTLPTCRHVLHKNCLLQLLDYYLEAKCPSCRRDINYMKYAGSR